MRISVCGGKLQEGVYLSSKESIAPTRTGTRSPTEITNKIYELGLEKHLDRADILEDNIPKFYSILWGHCTEALEQGLCGHDYFEGKYISFDTKSLLHQIKLTTQGIKDEGNGETVLFVECSIKLVF